MICGNEKKIYYDNKTKKIYIEVGIENETPIIRIQNEREETLLTLHLKEAIKLKSVIEILAFDYLEDLIEKV